MSYIIYNDITKGFIMIKLTELLNEYISNPIINLRDYLEKSEDEKINEIGMISDGVHEWLMYHYSDLANQYEDHEEYEITEILERDHPEVYHRWGKHVLENIDYMSQDRPGWPSWQYMEYSNLVKNQWLIHFSDYASSIYRDKKFKHLVHNYDELGLTTYYKDDSYIKSEDGNGYGFCYTIDDFERYAKDRHGYKYGKYAVMFRASGVRVWHYGDEEYQTIFYGPTAKDFVYIHNYDNTGDWVVGGYIYSGVLDDVGYWVEKNYNQYKKLI